MCRSEIYWNAPWRLSYVQHVGVQARVSTEQQARLPKRMRTRICSKEYPGCSKEYPLRAWTRSTVAAVCYFSYNRKQASMEHGEEGQLQSSSLARPAQVTRGWQKWGGWWRWKGGHWMRQHGRTHGLCAVPHAKEGVAAAIACTPAFWRKEGKGLALALRGTKHTSLHTILHPQGRAVLTVHTEAHCKHMRLEYAGGQWVIVKLPMTHMTHMWASPCLEGEEC